MSLESHATWVKWVRDFVELRVRWIERALQDQSLPSTNSEDIGGQLRKQHGGGLSMSERRSTENLTLFRVFHSTKGSWTKVSKTLINASILARSTPTVISDERRKTPESQKKWVVGTGHRRQIDGPSTPVTPIPSIIFWVKRNGILSGTSNVLAWMSSNNCQIRVMKDSDNGGLTLSKRQLKSTCTVSPVIPSIRIFS